MPAFSSPIDCTPWVIGGLWPAELSTITDENASLAEHLRADLQRITSRTNDELKILKRSGLDDAARQAAETRAIDEARAHAARRVESAIRHLRARTARPDYPRHPNRRAAERFPHFDRDKTQIIPAVAAVSEPVADKTEVIPALPATAPTVERPVAPVDDAETTAIPEPPAVEPDPEPDPEPEPETTRLEVEPETTRLEALAALDEPEPEPVVGPVLWVDDDEDDAGGRHRISGDEDDVTAAAPEAPEPSAVEAEPETTRLEALAALDEPELEPVVDPVLLDGDEDDWGRHRTSGEEDDAAQTAVVPEPQAPPEDVEYEEPEAPDSQHEVDDETGVIPAAEAPAIPVPIESDSERLRRILAFVVRQEPQLNWAVGDHADGTTVLVTDLAHGWIPPGITLPAGVRLLAPARRAGKASALLGQTTQSATYTPGDPVGRTADFAATEPSVQARELPAVDDMGWELGRVTHWRDGLPRLVHTLAKAATSGTGVVEEEADLLRVHLDTARYQVLTQYPDVEPALLLNCLLLAATESTVAGDPVSANYHFAWFQKLDEPPASQWSVES